MRVVSIASCALLLVALARPAQAQSSCAHVLAGFEPPGTDGVVRALQVVDLGNGPALYVGGGFGAAGTSAAANIARFDGTSWSNLGAGVGPVTQAFVQSLTVANFGAGTVLVAGGNFQLAGGAVANNVAAWNGTTWTSIGSGLNGDVYALAFFDDGTGPKLYAGGRFYSPANHVVRFNGTAWEPVGGGVNGQVFDFCVHDDGSGPALYAGYEFSSDGTSVARWNGSSWITLGVISPASVETLASYDDGSGRKLYAGVDYHTGTIQGVQRWNGAMWENVGTIGGAVHALEVLDIGDGNGPRLLAGGDFTTGANKVARWDGSTWTTIGTGSIIEALALGVFDTGNGKRLFAGASMHTATSMTSSGLSRLEGTNWIAAEFGHGLVNSELGGGMFVHALAQHDAGAGPEVYVGGQYMYGAPASISHPIARWDGSGWTGIYLSTNDNSSVTAFLSFDLGAGPELFAGAGGIWRQTGSTWALIGGAFGVFAFQVYDVGAGPRVAACGNGVTPSFPPPGLQDYALVNSWDGTTLTTLGTSPPSSIADALAFFDDGSGPALYCGGVFSTINNTPGTQGIARWRNGWSSVGGGLTASGQIEALAVYDDGSGPALYASGQFTSIGGQAIADIARWNGSTWSSVGGGLTASGQIDALAVYDDGSGSALFAGGDFTTIGGVSARHLARWNGNAWSAIGSGADGKVNALASIDEGTGYGRTLWIVGDFSSVDGHASTHVARFGCSPDTGHPFCFGDAAHGATPCPCGNSGSVGHGCASGVVAAGAVLSASGSTLPSMPGGNETVVLACSSMPPTAPALFFQGDAASPPTPFGDGARCVGGAQIRLATKIASGGIAQYPVAGDVPLSVRGQTPPGSGRTRFYQVWYRTNSTLCTSGTFNLSGGWTITW